VQVNDRDKRMVIVLAVVAGLGAIYLVLKVLGGGGGGTVAGPTGPIVTGPPTLTPTPSPHHGGGPPVDISGNRDPFSIPPALVGTSGATGATGTTGGTTGGTGATGSTSPPPTTSPSSSPSSSPSPSPSPSPHPRPGPSTKIGGHEVRLDDVFAGETKTKTKVDGKLYVVEEGARFAGTFKLTKILGPRCARFLYGDEAFELCL
jgi:hypothetical protein